MISQSALFERVSAIIENRKSRAQAQANQEVVLIFLEIGRYIKSFLLGGERADYGKQIVVTLSQQLQEKYGSCFEYTNVTRMIRFTERFPDFEIVVPLAQQFSWSIEADLEKAILSDLEAFILKFRHGFTFADRQKRMTMDSEDYTLDLLFYHRILKRLVAIELKLGKFKPSYMGQMRFYLKWLNRYERHDDENSPIGLILCTEASRDQIELMELDKEGIAVAEYWTQLPPKIEFERKIGEIYTVAQERLERRKALPVAAVSR